MAYQKALHRVRPFGGISPLYVRYVLEHLATTGQLIHYTTGSTIKHIPQRQLRDVIIPLSPLAEQHRIVDALDNYLSRLDVGVGQLRGCLERVVVAKESLLAAACCGRLVGGAASGEVNLDGGPPIPVDWEWSKLDSIAEVVGGAAKDSKRQAQDGLVEVPYLRVANVQRGHLDLSRVATIRVPVEKAKRLALKRGDVLLNEGGDRDKLGRGWVWSDEIENCIHQNHVFRVRLVPDTLHPKLLAWYSNTIGRRWFESHGKQTTNLASVSLSTVKQLPVPVPPLREQADLVMEVERRLSELDVVARMLQRAELSAARLRRALLKAAFTGQLSSQDAGDEPATALLERIRAERERAAVPTRRRRASSGSTAGTGAVQTGVEMDL